MGGKYHDVRKCVVCQREVCSSCYIQSYRRDDFKRLNLAKQDELRVRPHEERVAKVVIIIVVFIAALLFASKNGEFLEEK